MANLYDRKFKIGRQGEQIFNEELHKMYESVKHLTDHPENEGLIQPPAVLDGALWHDRPNNSLKYYDKANDKFVNIFQSKFQITDEITNIYPSSSPVEGQLWIYNDVLMYYSNGQWKPVKALAQDGSQLNASIFENFLFLSPLWKIGNSVLEGDIEAYQEEYRKYLQGVLDTVTNSQYTGDGSKWTIDHTCILNDPSMPKFPDEAKAQLIVPNIDVDRVFINEALDREYEEISKVCISYPKNHIADNIPSLLHINPGKLTNITKRLFKVDKAHPSIHVHPNQTEFYGFKKNSISGDLLLPFSVDNQKEYDYEVQDSGIYLSYNAAQSYDYVLSVTYEFNWFKSYGKMKSVSSDDVCNSYYVSGYVGPINVFVQGFNLENVSFETDDYGSTLTTYDDTSDLEVSALHTVGREYGFIRIVDLKNRGIVKPIKKFKNPFLFVAGEAMLMSDIEYDEDKNIYYIENAKKDMMWSIIDLYDPLNDFDMYLQHGYVTETNESGAAIISYDPEKLLESDTPVLFVNGLLLSESDIVRDLENHTLTAYGLDEGQDYTLLNDRYGYLYTDNELIPAIALAHFSESLAYLNGHLLCNSTATHTLLDEDEISAVHNEIKMFINNSNKYKIFDEQTESWKDISSEEIEILKKFVYGYNNAPRCVEILVPYEKEKDWIQIYTFNYANAIENPLMIRNVEITEQTAEIETISYLPQTGSLAVWLNGVRQYPEVVKDTETIPGIKEDITGTKFYFPEPITGHVTYTVQAPEKGSSITTIREILTHENASPGMINLYKTKNSLYPGRVTVYVNGVRQPQEAYTILDNYTIYFNDRETMLIGNESNYPTEKILVGNELKEFIHNESDKILIEVSMIEKEEKTIHVDDSFAYDINVNKYNIDINILEPSDEIVMFTNGLFFGASMLNGYKVNKSKGVITLTDSSTIHAITSNPLADFLMSNEENKKKYEELYNKEYEPKKSVVTLEWR